MKERKKINLIHYCNLSYALAFFINQYANNGTDNNPGVGPLCCMILDQIKWRVEADNKNKFTPIPQRKLARFIGLSANTVHKYLDYLIDLGIIEKKLVGHNITAFRINYEKLQSIIDEAEKQYFPDKTDDNDVEDVIPNNNEESNVTEEKEYREIKQQAINEVKEEPVVITKQERNQLPSIFEETNYIESKPNDIRKSEYMPIVTNTNESLTDEEFTNAVLYKVLPYYDELPDNLKNVTLLPDKNTLKRKDDGQLTGRITNVKWESVETEKCPHCGFPVPKISKIKCPHCGDVLVRATVRDEDGITRFCYR